MQREASWMCQVVSMTLSWSGSKHRLITTQSSTLSSVLHYLAFLSSRHTTELTVLCERHLGLLQTTTFVGVGLRLEERFTENKGVRTLFFIRQFLSQVIFCTNLLGTFYIIFQSYETTFYLSVYVFIKCPPLWTFKVISSILFCVLIRCHCWTLKCCQHNNKSSQP